MKNSFFRLPENTSPQARNAFQIALAIAVAHFIAVPYYLYLILSTKIVQFGMLAVITLVLAVLISIGTIVAWRGKPINGMILALGTLAVFYPPISVFLVSGLGSVLGIALIFVGAMSAFQVLPRRSAWVMTVITVVSGLATLLLDVFGSTTRPSLPGIFILLLTVAVIVILAYFIVRQMWTSGRLRNRIIVLMVVVLLPVLTFYSYLNVRAQQQDLEQALLDSAKANAITGATAIGTSLEDAIANGQLTTEEVFDQNYIKFFEFDPSNYPDLTDDPSIYNKYHTAYDTYADEHWQKLFDSYLTDPDILFAVASDINGYVPTHNTVFSLGDGNPSTDRTKRIFNDVVGTTAARNTEPDLQQIYLQSGTGKTLWDVSAPIYVNGKHWGAFRVGVQLAQNQLRVQASTLRAVISSSIMLAIVVVFAWLFGSYITNPVERLTKASQEAASGSLDMHIDIPNRDEITILAKAFNSMTSRLREILETLEQRVAARTRNLELAAEVGRTVSQVRDLDVMLRDACELILKEFDLYYVQVYLTDSSQTTLRLESGTGAVAEQLLQRGHSLPLNTASINGRAAVEKHTVVISDTTQSSTFRQNPLLPDTRGEMAVPLIVANKVVGVLDMQSSSPGVLNDEVLPAFEALAGQLAVAIQNANLLAETEQARAQVEAQARRLVRQGWNEHLDAIHMPEQLGYVFDHNNITQLADFDDTQFPRAENAISAPIAVAGETLGSLLVELHDDARREQTSELVKVVAQQVSQQIENLRLLDSAERYRHEAEEASHRLTREGWKSYAERTSESLSYIYDLNEVRPQNSVDQKVEAAGYTLPLKVREETIGRLVVQGLEAGDDETLSLASTVAERLSAHIESLRQFDESRNSQMELDKRAKQLAAVAEVSTASTALLDPAQVLQSVVNLTKERFDLYHAHVYLLNESADTLKLAAGAGDVGRQMVAEGWQISVDHQDSIVARAVRTRQSVISNEIVHDIDSEFLSNRLLPDTRSEMAVPLMVGDNILGVFDVQSDRINAFTEEDANIQTTLASQVATSLQNARSFTRAQKQAERESRLNVISQKIQSATTVEAVLQIAARELGQTLGAPLTIAQLGLKETASGN